MEGFRRKAHVSIRWKMGVVQGECGDNIGSWVRCKTYGLGRDLES